MEKRTGGDSRERLSRARIYDAALLVIDRGGIESLSMRSLARELGVKAASLYYHFEGKDQLLDGLADSLYRQLRPPALEESGWTENLSWVFLTMQGLIQKHPSAAPLLIRRLVRSPKTAERAWELVRGVFDVREEPEPSAVLMKNLVALMVGHSLMLTWRPDHGGEEDRADDATLDDGLLTNGSLAALTAGLEALVRGFAVGETANDSPLRLP